MLILCTSRFDYVSLFTHADRSCTSGTVGQRASFFQSLRKNLEEAATEGYSQFQRSCLLASQRIKEQYSDVPFLQDCSALQSVRRDKYSTRFLPKPLSHITPLQCYGDGNCLFRYAPDIYIQAYKNPACAYNHTKFMIRLLSTQNDRVCGALANTDMNEF